MFCVFILVVLFLLSSQPCPAKVAVPCPAAFAPGKSRLVACFYTVWLEEVSVDLGLIWSEILVDLGYICYQRLLVSLTSSAL